MERRLRKNKRGVADLVYVVLAAMALGILMLVFFKITSSFDTQVQASSSVDSFGKAASTQMVAHFPGIIDNIALFLVIGFCILALVLASLVRVSPIFFPFFLLALVFVLVFSAIASNIYQEMAASSDLAAEASQLTNIGLLLTYLPKIIAVFATLLAIVMYKAGGNDGY